jgi:hypothetical protein
MSTSNFSPLALFVFLCLFATTLTGQNLNTSTSIFDLMNYREVLSVTLEADFTTINSNRKEEKAREGLLTFKDEKGITQTWNIRLRPRGHFRRMKCEMTPLKIDFSKQDLTTAGLAEFDDMKLVTHCVENKMEAKILLQKEYLAYKLYSKT